MESKQPLFWGRLKRKENALMGHTKVCNTRYFFTSFLLSLSDSPEPGNLTFSVNYLVWKIVVSSFPYGYISGQYIKTVTLVFPNMCSDMPILILHIYRQIHKKTKYFSFWPNAMDISHSRYKNDFPTLYKKWWTGRPGVLQTMGLQRVGHNWATELNWAELNTRLTEDNFKY